MTLAETTFLRLTAAQWTAIGTVALVGVTAVYVVQAGRGVKMARRAAEAAERAATAARDAVGIQRASVHVSFSAECTFLRDTGVFRVENVGAAVYVHSVVLAWLTDTAKTPSERLIENYEFPWQDAPKLMHRDDTMMWRLPQTGVPEEGIAGVRVTYSFEREGERLDIDRHCSVEKLIE